MRPKFQKQSALKLAGRIIPQSGISTAKFFNFSKFILLFFKGEKDVLSASGTLKPPRMPC